GGGTGSSAVTALAGCGWTATSNDGWITVTGGATGSGPGTATFSAAANPLTSNGTGTLTIAGNTFTVTQPGLTCTNTISPTSQTLTSAGGPATVNVTAAGACNWTAVSTATWITVSSGASGSGNGTVALNVAANTATTT